MRVAVAATLFVAGLALPAATAGAAEGLIKYSMKPSTTQAGGHPDIEVVQEWFNRAADPKAPPCYCDDVRVIATHSPTGLIGNPRAIPICTLSEYSLRDCPEEAQVGWMTVLGNSNFQTPVYNMETHPDQAGLIAFTVPGLVVPVFLDISGRTESDYGLDLISAPIWHPLPINNIEMTLWGVPAEPKNDNYRFKTPLPVIFAEKGASSNAPLTPYLQNPTTCGEPLTAGLDLFYYTGKVVHAETDYPATTGCDTLSFNPSLAMLPTTTQAESPTGIDIDVKVPQTQSPTTPSPSEIRAATVRFPVGLSFNSSAADGKTSCSDADSAIGTRHGATCPELSKVGTASIDSSALPGPIPGAIYLGDPKPNDRYRIILTGDGFGTHVKLAGSVHADSRTGQLVASFQDLPQSPFSEFSMHLFGSERGVFSTPSRCGTYEVRSEFVPWDAKLATQSSINYFTIDSGPNGTPCPSSRRPSNPGLEAGSANNTAGSHSPFIVRVSRNDGDQSMAALNVTTPPGFSATLRGIPYCPDAVIDRLGDSSYSGLSELTSPACPAASEIGSATAGVGVGSRPLFVRGKVYLTGPYKGAPLSLVAVIPAVSGPYDFGNVAVRAAIHVDPVTAQVSTLSDPLPQILEGVPLRTRSILLELGRPDFALNPTNCDPFTVDAAVFGDEGTTANPSSHFQVANCADLPYRPGVSLRLSGGLRRRGHPAIAATFRAHPGEANSRKVAVTLPRGQLLDNAHIETTCTRVDFANEACPAGSQIGKAEVTSPLLDKPLTGFVYLRASSNKLPDLVMDLKGQVHIELVARIDSVNGQLQATFANLPDVPVNTVRVNLAGGEKGVLINSESLCGVTKRAIVRMTGQNNVSKRGKATLLTACGSKASHHRLNARKAVR